MLNTLFNKDIFYKTQTEYTFQNGNVIQSLTQSNVSNMRFCNTLYSKVSFSISTFAVKYSQWSEMVLHFENKCLSVFDYDKGPTEISVNSGTWYSSASCWAPKPSRFTYFFDSRAFCQGHYFYCYKQLFSEMVFPWSMYKVTNIIKYHNRVLEFSLNLYKTL